MNRPQKSELELFTEAVQLPPEKRSAFLESACGQDVRLPANVGALLRAHVESGEFLEQAPAEIKPQTALPREKAGDRVGRYKLLRKFIDPESGLALTKP
jgi:hypothetical protein